MHNAVNEITACWACPIVPKSYYTRNITPDYLKITERYRAFDNFVINEFVYIYAHIISSSLDNDNSNDAILLFTNIYHYNICNNIPNFNWQFFIQYLYIRIFIHFSYIDHHVFSTYYSRIILKSSIVISKKKKKKLKSPRKLKRK